MTFFAGQGEMDQTARRSCLLGMAMAMLALSFSASASLGGDRASVQADQIQMNATLRTTDAPNYTLFEIQTSFGLVVREYASSTGLVFAVAWTGPSLPNLRQILGSYFDAYVQGENVQGVGVRPRAINQPQLVVYSSGHMRAFLGRAFIPGRVPQGVNLEDIQ